MSSTRLLIENKIWTVNIKCYKHTIILESWFGTNTICRHLVLQLPHSSSFYDNYSLQISDVSRNYRNGHFYVAQRFNLGLSFMYIMTIYSLHIKHNAHSLLLYYGGACFHDFLGVVWFLPLFYGEHVEMVLVELIKCWITYNGYLSSVTNKCFQFAKLKAFLKHT